MTKAELVEDVARAANLKKKDAERLVEIVFESIIETLNQVERPKRVERVKRSKTSRTTKPTSGASKRASSVQKNGSNSHVEPRPGGFVATKTGRVIKSSPVKPLLGKKRIHSIVKNWVHSGAIKNPH